MATKTRKASPRLSVPPPGIIGFADGGAIGGDGLTDAQRAKINGARSSLGISDVSPAPQSPEPKPQPQAQQRPEAQGITTGIIGIMKGRQQQIDKAAGYAEGGIIRGPGTSKSDSIPAAVRETGEQIAVSTDERIVSKEQGVFLEGVAKAAGYKNLDAMLEDGTGKPVGPIIRGGKRAAADGLPPDDDPFAYRGGIEFGGNGPSADDRSRAAIAAPPTLGGAPLARSEPLGTLTGPASGLTINLAQKPGRDAQGIITADSAKAAMADPMQRSGGIFGTMDLADQNNRMAKSLGYAGADDFNRQQANRPAAAAGILGLGADGMTDIERQNEEKTRRWRQDDLISLAQRGNQGAIAAALHANAQTESEAMRTAGTVANEQARGALVARGQDANLQRAAERNDVIARGQDMRAGTAADRIASNENIAGARIAERSGPTLGQQRGNAEIDAARERIAGMDAGEIKRRTANFTSTGRENPDYDPTLAKAVTLANRRKIGDDPHFDERQQQPAANQFGFDRKEVAGRFRSEKAMERYKLGNDTENGVEVLDSAGKIVGHYR